MKLTLINLCLAIAICSATNASAQSMAIIKTEPLGKYTQSNTKQLHGIRLSDGTAQRIEEDDSYIIPTAGVCFEKSYLAAISDTMFRQGNPNYIWVDLLKDGYVQDGDINWYNVYILTNGNSTGGNTDIPQEAGEAYANKWIRFVKSLEEPLSEHCSYSFTNYSPISALKMIDPNSDFRKISKSELNRLGLTEHGNLRFLRELVKDGLAPADKALDLEFSEKGFYVHGKRLTRELREKYMNLCEEEFGCNYYNDHSRIAIGSLPENTLGKRIAE